MPRLQQDKFNVFVSHKSDDKELADLVAEELRKLSPDLIQCWVSGQALTAGVDWDRQIKRQLAQSHLLILLFTTPRHTWDWCLYEVGLFVRFEADDVVSVACLFDPNGLTTRAAQPGAVRTRARRRHRRTAHSPHLHPDVEHVRHLATRRPRPRASATTLVDAAAERIAVASRTIMVRSASVRVPTSTGTDRVTASCSTSPRADRATRGRASRCMHESSRGSTTPPATHCRCSGPTTADRHGPGATSSTRSMAATRRGSAISITSSPRVSPATSGHRRWN